MYLRGQGPSSGGGRILLRQAGYAMAALLVAMNVMAIVMTVAMPLWKTVVKREKEEELIWRANQYVHAINLFRRKYANAYPPNIDILINERFLRKKYLDPMTKDGEFQLVYAAQQQQRPGLPAGQGGQTPGQVSPTPATAPAAAAPPPPLDQPAPGAAGAVGGIMGVVSKSSETGMRLINGRAKYSEWLFVARAAAAPGGPAGAGGAPGSQRPGPGQPTPRPSPGNGRPPGMNFPGFGVPPQPGQPPQPRPRPPL